MIQIVLLCDSNCFTTGFHSLFSAIRIDTYVLNIMKTKIQWIVIVVAFLPMLLLRDFTPDNEGRYLAIADEALRSGHFFSFVWDGQPYADKPPLYLWLVMLSRAIWGQHSMFALSLLSFIPAIGISSLMDQWTHKELPENFRRFATLMLFTTVYFMGPALVVRMDMLMCLFIVLALRSFWRLYTGHAKPSEQWLLGIWLFLALFTKGPLGILLPLISIIVYIGWQRRWHDIGKVLNWRTWIVIILGCTVWFALTYREAGVDYLYNLVFHQTVDRGINSFHHARPFYYYLISIWYMWLPWSLLCVVGIVVTLVHKERKSDTQTFFLCVALTTILLLSFISSKLQIYLLPAFPFVIYFTAYVIKTYDGKRWIIWMLAIPELIFALTLPALFVVRSLIDVSTLSEPIVLAAVTVLSLFSIASLFKLMRHKSLLQSASVLGYGVLSTLAILGLGMPILNQYIT